MFLFVTFLVIFKKERNKELEEDDHLKINIIQSYELLWDIFKIKHMKLLLMAILTSMVNNIFTQFLSEKLEIVPFFRAKYHIKLIIIHIILQLTFFDIY